MAELRKLECQMCGGILERKSENSYECMHCHSKFEIDATKVTDELIINLNRASAYRRKAKFDEAVEDYEAILKDYPDNFEAAWGLMLASKNINFFKTGENLYPVFYDVGAQSFFDNAYYKKAMALCPDPETYANKAMRLDIIRAKAYELSNKNIADIMLCCADETPEASLALPLITSIKARTQKTVFWSGRELSGRPESEWEPYLYSAIKQAKLLIVLTSSLNNCYNAQVENIWRRYLRLAKDFSEKKVILALYNCDLDDMPSELKRSLNFEIGNGDFNELLDEVERQFRPNASVKIEEKKEKGIKSTNEKQHKKSTPSKSCGTPYEHKGNAGESVSADHSHVEGYRSDIWGASGDIHTNPEALRMLARKIHDYGVSQQNVITECLYALGRLTDTWNDSHMMQILDEIGRLHSGYENKILEINSFVEWLEQKASLLESRTNIY